MNVFAVVFTDPSPQAAEPLLEAFPGAYELVPQTVYLVRSDQLSSDIAQRVGIKTEDRVSRGAVFKLNHAYSGYTSRSLWEWLGD